MLSASMSLKDINGIILVDKPSGITSFGVVSKIRETLKVKRVGHGGTLDPLATGVLPILVGNATKSASKFLDGEKAYVGEMVVGIVTDTDDSEGKILSSVRADAKDVFDRVKGIAGSFIGKIKQIPPMVSARHHKGQRLYDLARQGITVEREPREVTIHELRLLDFESADNPRIKFYCRCSKGTYIRALVHDIGDMLGTGAHLSMLRRVLSGPFSIEQALPLDEVLRLICDGQTDKILLRTQDING